MKYPKECPTCQGYMHRCEEYVPAKTEGGRIVEPAKGSFGQANMELDPGKPPRRNHEPGNWWRCLFCDYWEPLEVKAAKAS